MSSVWSRAHDCPDCGDTLTPPEGDGVVMCGTCGLACRVELDGDSDGERTWNLYCITPLCDTETLQHAQREEAARQAVRDAYYGDVLPPAMHQEMVPPPEYDDGLPF